MAQQPLGTTNPNVPTYASLAKLGLTGSEANKAMASYNAQSAAGTLPSAQQNFYGQVITTGADGTKYTDLSKQNVYNPVSTSTPESTSAPVEATSAAPTVKQNNWNLENDPLYQSAMNAGQSAFNTARNKANFELQNATVAQQAALRAQNQQAALDRRSLAGNFAARGMQGGEHGAYAVAQDRANAALITAQTSTKDQLAALNQQYIANYGADGTDWTATAEGQNYKNQAIQQALTALTNKYTAVA